MNRYTRKRKTKEKMKKLHDKHVYFISKKDTDNGEVYYQRLYLSGCRKLAKRETSRKIRKSKNDFKMNGCAYRRKFDYWNTLF